MSRLPHLSLTTVLVCAAAVAIGSFAVTSARYFVHNYQLHQQESQMRGEIVQLNRDHAQLVAIRDYLKTDQYIEQIARRVLGLVHPGETLVIVSASHGVPATATPRAVRGDEPWWKELYIGPPPAATPQPGG
ncbi:MAG: FtsB family cell division protein [Dehalococcoidia bacterium]